MGLDADFTTILRDLVHFLEAVSEVKLPPSLESVRENLLSRSKSTLLTLAIGPPSSPEPYLDMNAGKGLLLASKSHIEIRKYVNTDRSTDARNSQDYYETFQEINNPKIDTSLSIEDEKEVSVENTLASIYSSFSAVHTRMNCSKYGQLFRKSEKKMFPFIDPLRVCWVGLLGSHLLIYGSEKDCRPNAVIPIRGYRGRPAPSIDSKRSESAFEIFCPGHKTLQFVAKTPEEMEEWVAMICETSNRENDNKTRFREPPFIDALEMEQKEAKNSDIPPKEERYQDASFRISLSKSKETLLSPQPPLSPDLDKSSKSEVLTREKSTKEELDEDKSPPLPARIPRRLPALPHEEVIPSFESVDEPYDEDDIYHKIEDFRDGTGYQNCMVAKKEEERRKKEARKNCYLETYDDVVLEIRPQNVEVSKSEEVQQAYDDIRPVIQEILPKEVEIKREETVVDSAESYDDVQMTTADLSSKPAKQSKEKKLSDASRIKAKKTFLDRMRNRSYNLRKEKAKKRDLSPAKVNPPESLPTYDDISGMTVSQPQQKKVEVEEEQFEYLTPPAPRPVYSVPPVTTCLVEQLYDDIVACQDENSREIPKHENPRIAEIEVSPLKLDIIPEQCFQSGLNNSNGQADMEFEYYQSPKSDRVVQVEDALYDDVALLTKFRAKSREPPVSNFEKVWSRFSSVRSKSSATETEENTDLSTSSDQQEVRVNRFQKLVNKIENTLGKSSVKPVPLSNSKSHSSSSIT